MTLCTPAHLREVADSIVVLADTTTRNALRDAADEIERLTAERNELRGYLSAAAISLTTAGIILRKKCPPDDAALFERTADQILEGLQKIDNHQQATTPEAKP